MNTISFPNMFNIINNKLSTNLSYNIKSINESLKSLLLTSPGELLGDPAYGCRMKEKIFDIKSFNDIHEIKSLIIEAVNKYVPRIHLIHSNIIIFNNPNNNKYKISLRYTIKNTNEVGNLDIII